MAERPAAAAKNPAVFDFSRTAVKKMLPCGIGRVIMVNNTGKASRWRVSSCDYKKRRYLLCGSASGDRLGTGRRPPGADRPK